MPNYTQKSYIRKYGNKDNFMEINIIEDIKNIILQLESIGGDQQVLGSSVWANGFKVTDCINVDITLPANTNIEYNGPLSMCLGATLTVPLGTTLTIL